MHWLTFLQMMVAVLLTLAILLQQRSSSLGQALGSGGMDGSYYTRRGFERFLVYATVILAVLFAAISIAQVIRGA